MCHEGVTVKATVKVINPSRGMYAAEIDGDGGFVVFELLDTTEPEIGDEISHPDFYSLGGETIKNLTQDCEIDVSIEDVCGAALVKQKCFLR